MKYIIIFNLLTNITINPLVNAHEDHDHQIYNWSNSKSKTTKTDSSFNLENLDDKKKYLDKNIKKMIQLPR